ncbi:MAG: FapA family protein [Peptococcaceae bacterium]
MDNITMHSQPEDRLEKNTLNTPGQPLAWLEKGELKVIHPEEGPFPQVVPCRGIELTVNGKVCRTPTTIKKNDQVQLKTLTETRPGKLKIETSKDEMMAILRLKPKTEIKYEIEETLADAYLKLKVKENHLKLPPATFEEILSMLTSYGITTGVNRRNCLQAANCCEEKEFVIAQGVPCQPGEDARLEYLFNLPEKVKVEFEKEKKADFKQRFIYNCVEKGTILVKKVPLVSGKDGVSVFGKLVKPSVPRDIKLIAGRGTKMDSENNIVYTVENGLPKVRISNNKVFIEVVKILFQNDDVDIASGNIDFKGDVVIKGNVLDAMTVKATGNIEIVKNVTYANIFATGSITIRGNVISSSLISGGGGNFILKIISKLQIFCNLVRQLKEYILQVQQNPAFQEKIAASPAILVRFFLQDTKFKIIPNLLKEIKLMVNTTPEEFVPDGLFSFIKKAEKAFFAFQDTNLNEILNDTVNLLESLTAQAISEENIEINYALNSDLKATGSVKVIGQGCFNTKINVGGAVEITRVFRGGEIWAEGNVRVGELGSASGVRAKVLTRANSSVFIEKAWENTEVQLGHKLYRFIKNEQNVKLKLDEKGNIIFF